MLKNWRSMYLPTFSLEAVLSESFYPFVENNQEAGEEDIAAPAYTARIAVYDSMVVPPRVVMVPPADVRTYLDEITKNVWELATQQGGEWPFHIIRELVENYIHASFIEPTISIMDKGQTISFSDQGPGIPNKEAALRPTFSSATKAMKRYIRGTGSGLPMVEATVRLQHGTITIEDNLGQGAVITVSMAHKDEAAAQAQTLQQQTNQSAPWPQQPGQNLPAQMPSQQVNPTTPGYAWQQGQTGAQMPSQQVNPNMQGYAWPQTQQAYPQATQALCQPGQMYAPQYGPAQGTYPQQAYQTMPQTAYGAPQVPGVAAAMQQPTANLPTSAGDVAIARTQVKADASATPALQARAAKPDATEDTLRILQLFNEYEKVGTTEVSAALGISKATGTRRIKEACEEGFIVKSGQKYVLTTAGSILLNELGEGR